MTAEPRDDEGSWKVMADAMRLADITDELRQHMESDAPFEELTDVSIVALVNQASRIADEMGFDADDPDIRAALVSLWVHGFVAGDRYREGEA